jgi:hypothetical protein
MFLKPSPYSTLAVVALPGQGSHCATFSQPARAPSFNKPKHSTEVRLATLRRADAAKAIFRRHRNRASNALYFYSCHERPIDRQLSQGHLAIHSLCFQGIFPPLTIVFPSPSAIALDSIFRIALPRTRLAFLQHSDARSFDDHGALLAARLAAIIG